MVEYQAASNSVSLKKTVFVALAALGVLFAVAGYFMFDGLFHIRDKAEQQALRMPPASARQTMALQAEQLSRYGQLAIGARTVEARQLAMGNFETVLGKLRDAELASEKETISRTGEEVRTAVAAVNKITVLTGQLVQSRERLRRLLANIDNVLESTIEDTSTDLQDLIEDIATAAPKDLADIKESIDESRAENTANFELLLLLRDMQALVIQVISEEKEDAIGESAKRFDAIGARTEPLLDELPSTGDYEDLTDLVSEFIAAKTVFPIRLEVMELSARAQAGSEKAQISLERVSRMLSSSATKTADLNIAGARETALLANHLEKIAFAGSAFVIVLLLAGVYLGNMAILAPLHRVRSVLGALVGGDTTVTMPPSRLSEFNSISVAAESFRQALVDRKEAHSNENNLREMAESKRRETLSSLADRFEAGVSGVVGAVSSAATEMGSLAQSISDVSDRTKNRVATVSTASRQADINVQTVSSAAKELAASINEISKQVERSSGIAAGAVSEAEGANTKFQSLATATQKIGEVADLISDIAEQTNLLALNATIEAARAGDAGKGFAVVANEVKSLANQTAKATEDISSQISGIQTAAKGAILTIHGIADTIGQMNEIALSIATAVEKQGEVTNKIANNVEDALSGTQEVSTGVGHVNDAAEEASETSLRALSASEILTRQTDGLKQQVNEFLAEIKVQ